MTFLQAWLKKRNYRKGFSHAVKEHLYERYCTLSILFLVLIVTVLIIRGNTLIEPYLLILVEIIALLSLFFRVMAGYHHNRERHHFKKAHK